ncbi:cbb3-type cytochrome oxidase subunit 3 [Pontibacter pamirensis]|uniref:cbb3-type cytochrome oxidase subunit 3 n=1 Tax=Pontibacter pamirensis TaxID=2562824 RepID=UPI0013894CDC|nr:cbb3-type cytochrome c oxidase subunit 3 [Pontibacter pamirensis]
MYQCSPQREILLLSATFCRCATFILLVFCLQACATSGVPEQAEVPDYTEVYHPVINVAELEIVEGNYEEALAAYQQAFAAVPTPFARDYYNAAVSAVKLGDEKQAFDYLEQLVIKGVSLPYLERQQVFDSLQTSRQWKKFEKQYPKRRKRYEEAANLILRDDLDELYARDQYFRQAKGGLRVHGDTIRQIEADNITNLLNWINDYGYPGEALIGVADTLEELPRFSIVIQRQTAARNGYDFKGILSKAVKEGRIAPQPAAYLLDQQAGNIMYGSRAFAKISCRRCKENDKNYEKIQSLLLESMSDEELAQTDKRRKQLGLEPLQEYRKKVLHNAEDAQFKLNYDWSVKNYVAPSSEAADVLLERLTVAED